MIAVFHYSIWVFVARSADRFGKGVRTGARDALLSAESSEATCGCVFGFHRAMDTVGDVLGLCFALFYLYFYPENYHSLFFIALIPCLMAVLAMFWLKEKTQTKPHSFTHNSFLSFLHY
ncbi:MAG: hypothetical protein ACK4GL_11495 [Flavobacteriales bacterium]